MKNLLFQLNLIKNNELNQWKKLAYQKAIDTLSTMSEEEIDSRDSFIDLPGIGNSINLKIIEYKNTGSIEKAKSYYPVKHRVSYDTLKIPYEDAMNLWRTFNVDFEYEMVGSLRRKVMFVGDFDILVDEKLYRKAVDHFNTSEFEMLSSGDKETFYRHIKSNLQIDIIAYNQFMKPFFMLHFTGSKENNIYLRRIAKEKGLMLNQYGLYKGSDRIEGLKSEEDIYKYLNVKYAEPEYR